MPRTPVRPNTRHAHRYPPTHTTHTCCALVFALPTLVVACFPPAPLPACPPRSCSGAARADARAEPLVCASELIRSSATPCLEPCVPPAGCWSRALWCILTLLCFSLACVHTVANCAGAAASGAPWAPTAVRSAAYLRASLTRASCAASPRRSWSAAVDVRARAVSALDTVVGEACACTCPSASVVKVRTTCGATLDRGKAVVERSGELLGDGEQGRRNGWRGFPTKRTEAVSAALWSRIGEATRMPLVHGASAVRGCRETPQCSAQSGG